VLAEAQGTSEGNQASTGLRQMPPTRMLALVSGPLGYPKPWPPLTFTPPPPSLPATSQGSGPC
jgi:hypothetical protein